MKAARRVDRPEPGFFRVRLVRRGPWLAARIYRPCPMHPETCEPLDRFFPLAAEIDGAPADVFQVWESGDPIRRNDFDFMTAKAAWARRVHGAAHPLANPRRPITWEDIPVLFHER